jgi:hypothetical protein
MRTRFANILLVLALLWQGAVHSEPNANPLVTVYKTPACGCCEKWIQHLRAAGFTVEAHDHGNLDRVRDKLGVPRKMAGCHSAQVAGYAVEGHVPADRIKQLLAQKPDVVGISVPGMPVGSPGMEGEGGREYQVFSWREDGSTSVFSVEQPRTR